MKEIIIKIHHSPDGSRLVAMCDAILLGKKFEEGNKQLDLSGNFYKGEAKEEKDTIILLRASYALNIVGEKAILLCDQLGIIDKKRVITIAGIPHAEAMVEEE